MSEVSYYPQFGRLLPDGKLRIPTAGVFPTGEKWDGAEDVGPEHPSYPVWLEIVTLKEEYRAAVEEERKKARAERRRQRGRTDEEAKRR